MADLVVVIVKKNRFILKICNAVMLNVKKAKVYDEDP